MLKFVILKREMCGNRAFNRAWSNCHQFFFYAQVMGQELNYDPYSVQEQTVATDT